MAAEARDRRARGETLISIAKSLGISRTSVSRHVDDDATTRPTTAPGFRRPPPSPSCSHSTSETMAS